MVDYSLHKKLLLKVSQSELYWVHSQGYTWFHEIFIPALETAAASSLISADALSSCYYIAGDIADFNDAPKRALEYYHTALNFDPYCAGTHREIANMLERIGKYDEALKYLNKAIALDPDDDCALRDLENISTDGPALYKEGDVLWSVCEHLANAEPTQGLALVRNMNDEMGLRGKTFCYGALDEADKYLKTWHELIQKSATLDLKSADWFYMSDNIYEGSEIWAILLSSKAEFSGLGGNIESLENNQNYRALTTNNAIRLSFEYHKYIATKDYKAMKKLLETYPEWTEIREYLTANH